MYLIQIIVRVDGHVQGNLELGLEEVLDKGGPWVRRDNQMLGFQRPARRLHANGCSGRIDLEHAPFSVDIDPVSTAELGQRREGICCCNDAGVLVVDPCPAHPTPESVPGGSDKTPMPSSASVRHPSQAKRSQAIPFSLAPAAQSNRLYGASWLRGHAPYNAKR